MKSFFATFWKVAIFLVGCAVFPFAYLFADNTTTTVEMSDAVRMTYSKEVIFKAQPRLTFLQFAKEKTEKVGIGQGINFIKYNNLGRGKKISESEKMPANKISGSKVSIVVAEYGNSVEVSQALITTTSDLIDVLDDASTLLANDMALVLDDEFRDAALSTPNIIFGNGKASAQTLVAGDGLNTKTVKNALEFLSKKNAPKFEGKYYVCIASPHQLRQLRDDSAWINVNMYSNTAGGRNIFLGEVGMYEGVIFIETNQMPTHTSAQISEKFGSGVSLTALNEAIMFGENVLGWAIALPVEIRDGGIHDFGRIRKFGWYSIFGVGIIEPDNAIRIVTAPNS